MSTNTSNKLEKIRKVSAIVTTLCKICFLLCLGAFLAAVVGLMVGSYIGTVKLVGQEIAIGKLTLGSRLLILLLIATVMSVVLKGIYHLHALFKNYAAGKIFSTQAVAQIRKLGITFLYWAGLHVVSPFFANALLFVSNWSNRRVDISLPYESLLTAGFLILISWVMETGKGLREENELTI